MKTCIKLSSLDDKVIRARDLDCYLDKSVPILDTC